MSDPVSTVWRPVEGFPNYVVSDAGQVRSLPRERVRGGILKVARDHRGYWNVCVCHDGKTKRVRVHKLVAEAFIGPCPPGQLVRHLNDDKDDNRAVNLAYGTSRDNFVDMVRNNVWARPPRPRREKASAGPRTHCRRDHELTPENVYVGPDGKRRCRTCGADRFRRRDERKRQQRKAAA